MLLFCVENEIATTHPQETREFAYLRHATIEIKCVKIIGFQIWEISSKFVNKHPSDAKFQVSSEVVAQCFN